MSDDSHTTTKAASNEAKATVNEKGVGVKEEVKAKIEAGFKFKDEPEPHARDSRRPNGFWGTWGQTSSAIEDGEWKKEPVAKKPRPDFSIPDDVGCYIVKPNNPPSNEKRK